MLRSGNHEFPVPTPRSHGGLVVVRRGRCGHQPPLAVDARKCSRRNDNTNNTGKCESHRSSAAHVGGGVDILLRRSRSARGNRPRHVRPFGILEQQGMGRRRRHGHGGSLRVCGVLGLSRFGECDAVCEEAKVTTVRMMQWCVTTHTPWVQLFVEKKANRLYHSCDGLHLELSKWRKMEINTHVIENATTFLCTRMDPESIIASYSGKRHRLWGR
mmetsp:Transcript_30612/g.64656  ORF Transcript_30612/g.64656 Transcript_30612/m.64656 type:complete len:215 (-) Transcript_30612:48-692(-)